MAGRLRHLRSPSCAGINIAGTGFQYWGGGVFCAENVNGLAPQQIACQVPVPPANTTFVTGECYAPAVSGTLLDAHYRQYCLTHPYGRCACWIASGRRCKQHGLSAAYVTLLGAADKVLALRSSC